MFDALLDKEPVAAIKAANYVINLLRSPQSVHITEDRIHVRGLVLERVSPTEIGVSLIAEILDRECINQLSDLPAAIVEIYVRIIVLVVLLRLARIPGYTTKFEGRLRAALSRGSEGMTLDVLRSFGPPAT